MPQIMPGHADLAGADVQQSAQHPEGGAFPGAVGTEQTENFTVANCEGETLDRFEITERFPQIPGLHDNFFIPDRLGGRLAGAVDLKAASLVRDQGHKGVFKGRRRVLDGCPPLFRQGLGHGPDAHSVGDHPHPPGTDGGIHDVGPAGQVRVYPPGFDPRRRIHQGNPLHQFFFKLCRRSLGELLTLMQHHHMVASLGLVQVGGGKQHPDAVFFHKLVNDFPQFPARDRIYAHGRLV